MPTAAAAVDGAAPRCEPTQEASTASSSSCDGADCRCEVVWVRCFEPVEALKAALPPGTRLTVVEKCGLPLKGASASNTTSLRMANTGDEGWAYISWILDRWASLPACAVFLHGAHRYVFAQYPELFRCLRPASHFAPCQLSLPLSGHYNSRGMRSNDVGRGLDVFYNFTAASRVHPLVTSIPDVRGVKLGLFCCNTWLLTRNAIRSRPHSFWKAMRDVALLPVEGKSPTGKAYATRASPMPEPHPEIAIIYEHVFHILLGHPVVFPHDPWFPDLKRAFRVEGDECANVARIAGRVPKGSTAGNSDSALAVGK